MTSFVRPVLGYWNTRALAEPIRLLLHYAGVSFEDKRYELGAPPDYDKGVRSRSSPLRAAAPLTPPTPGLARSGC